MHWSLPVLFVIFVTGVHCSCCSDAAGPRGFPGRTNPGTFVMPLSQHYNFFESTDEEAIICDWVRFHDLLDAEIVFAGCGSITPIGTNPVQNEGRFAFVLPHTARLKYMTAMLTLVSADGAQGTVTGNLILRRGTQAAVEFQNTGLVLDFS